MFRCNVCKASVGPRIKSHVVVNGVRRKEYYEARLVNPEFDRTAKEIVLAGSGYEISKELRICPACNGEGTETKVPPTTLVVGHIHEEPMARPLYTPFVFAVLDKAVERTNHESKRAKADYEAALPLLKTFADRNPNFKV
jgi:hypothetical protein